MATSKVQRQTVSLPAQTARRVKALARSRANSTSRTLVELVEAGLRQEEQKRQEFLALVERFRDASDPEEARRLGEELGRTVFGS